METTPRLPQDIPVLHKMVGDLQEEVNLLHQQLKLLRSAMFGRKSERLDPATLGQPSLFPGEEPTAEDAQPKQKKVNGYLRGKPRRKPLPEDLPREDLVHDLPEADKLCACGHEMTRIGEEVSEQLSVVPESFKVIRNIRPKYACRACQGVESKALGEPTVNIAPMPAQLLPKSIATAALLAYIAVAKYVDGMPLYRLEQRFERLNYSISRKTMTDWMIKVGEKLQPLWQVLLAEIKAAPWVGMDETRMKVFDKKDKKNKTKHRNGHMWVLHTRDPHPITLFRYHPGREADLPREVLDGFRGTVVTDEWRAYDFLDRGLEKDTAWAEVDHALCWAHARRKFVDVVKALDSKNVSPTSLTGRVLKRIRFMYILERKADENGFTDDVRSMMRQTATRPLLNALREDLENAMKTKTPVGTLKKAVFYVLRNWDRLTLFLENGALPPDNNGVENAIRPFVIGRKAWLFAGSAEGARASAVLYSLAETAKANKLDPFGYLTHLFEALPLAKSRADYQALLPIQATSANK